MIDSNSLHRIFPWRNGQLFELLVDGGMFFPAILKAIDAAESHVLIEMYIIESGDVTNQFIAALVRATRKGIKVNLLLDAYGARGLVAKDRKYLEQGGIHTVYFNPLHFHIFRKKLLTNLFRTHRKFIVIDGSTAFVGGAGISDSFTGDTGWRDCMLQVRGSLAADWQVLFQRNLRQWSKQAKIPEPIDMPSIGEALGRVIHSSGGVNLPLKGVLLNRIRRCDQRVWLASAYFIPSAKIRRALRKLSIQGKDVRLLLPGPVTDHPGVRYASRRYYARLLRHGVRIFEYQERFMHTKVVLIDDWCTIGSSNMDRWNFRWNLEANQEVEDHALVREVQAMLENDFIHSQEIIHNEWLNRSWLQRLREWGWGRIDRWLTTHWKPGK